VRRQPGLGRPVLPGRRRPVPSVTVCIDTSGSMGDARVSHALTWTQGALEAHGIRRKVRVVTGGTGVASAASVWHASQVIPLGGGGTDMGALLTAAIEMTPPSDVIICLTDGLTPRWPERPQRHVRVLVGLYGRPSFPLPDWLESFALIEEAA